MGSPIFFQETHYYSEDARKQIRPLLKVYKEHRNTIYKGYVFPIGDKPDNSSWSGFQCIIPGEKCGYMTLFRQIESKESRKTLKLKFLEPGTALKVTDLMGDITRSVTVGADDTVEFEISKAPGFLFLRYDVQ